MAEAADKNPHPMVVLKDYLQERSASLLNALPPHIKPDRFISAVMTAVQLNPDLLACDRRSLWLACMRCAQDGLLPDGTEGALVPFKTKATYVPMYQGLLKKFRNSGQFKWVASGIAYEGEVYENWIDQDGPHFKHVPSNEDPKAKIHRVYALATTKDGGSFITELSMAQINKRRGMSRASRDDAPWKVWPEEMMKKTALRVLSNLLPKSSDIDAFLQRDEEESLGVQTAGAVTDQRGAAYGNVLDHFANEESPTGADAREAVSTAKEPEGGATQGAATTEASIASQPSRDPAAAIDVVQKDGSLRPTDTALIVAFHRGEQAKAAGAARRAIPVEYRDDTHQREVACWQAGYDGTGMPEF